MKELRIISVAFAFFLCICVNSELVQASESAGTTNSELGAVEAEDDSRGILTHLLLYIPNRVLDLLDIVRIRGRVGPGIGFGVRATKLAQANLASYACVYAGLPGPRMEAMPKLPVGLEVYTGLKFSIVEVDGELFGPDYSPTEFGLGGQFLLIGADVGIDPYEILDFAAGLFFIDLRDDDI